MNKIVETKAQIFKAIRNFFEKEGFTEVDTPTLVNSPDPSPFNEVFKIEGKNLYLTPSPEFFIKKLLSFGMKNVYQMTKAYRDWQENDPVHLSEFTILEWYRNDVDYFDLMKDCENLILFIYNSLLSFRLTLSDPKLVEGESKGHGGISFPNKKGILRLTSFAQDDNSHAKISYQDKKINLTPPWVRISCKEALGKYANVDLDEFLNIERAREVCIQHKYQVSSKNTWEELYHQIFLNEVEPKLPKEQPLILYDYPAPLAALSQIKATDQNYAERFEFYIGGLELGNGCSELTDAVEQEKRLKADIEERKRKDMLVFDYDHELVDALKSGLPKTAGIAVGVDRLVMLFTDSSNIHEVSPLAI